MRWDGPFKMVEKIYDLNYLKRQPTENHKTVLRVSRLKKWKRKEDEERESKEPPGNSTKEENEENNMRSENTQKVVEPRKEPEGRNDEENKVKVKVEKEFLKKGKRQWHYPYCKQ